MVVRRSLCRPGPASERRLLLPPTAHHPKHGPGDAALGVPELGVVGEVTGEADAGLGHGAPLPVAWPGGLPRPWTGGTVDTEVTGTAEHRGQAPVLWSSHRGC